MDLSRAYSVNYMQHGKDDETQLQLLVRREERLRQHKQQLRMSSSDVFHYLPPASVPFIPTDFEKAKPTIGSFRVYM